jgi:hypothetical protein
MAETGRNWGKVAGIGLCVVAVAGAAWAGRHWLDRRGDGDLHAKLAEGDTDEVRDALLSLDPEALKSEEQQETLEITVERMKQMSFSEMMDLMRSDDLTDEQRGHLRRVGREVMMARMEENVDEYMGAPKEDRQAILDRHLDEFLKFRDEMEAYREAHKDDPEFEKERERRRAEWMRRDTQREKERMEGGDPDRQKRMMFYFGKMRARAQERGVRMWGPGRGGGPRGGRSGGGSAGRSSGDRRPGGRPG